MSDALYDNEFEVGRNTYVTVEEADLLVSKFFVSTHPARIKWLGKLSTDEDIPEIPPLPKEDKEVLLLNSARYLNSLKYRGRRESTSQYLEFPRTPRSGVYGIISLPFIPQAADPNMISSGNYRTNGLVQAKRAQVENAVYGSIFDDESVIESTTRHITGITSLRSAEVNATYGNISSRGIDLLEGNFAPERVAVILRDWLTSSRHAL